MSDARHRISVHLSPSSVARVREIAEARGVTVADIIRVALGLFDAFEKARDDGLFVGTARSRDAILTELVCPMA